MWMAPFVLPGFTGTKTIFVGEMIQRMLSPLPSVTRPFAETVYVSENAWSGNSNEPEPEALL